MPRIADLDFGLEFYARREALLEIAKPLVAADQTAYRAAGASLDKDYPGEAAGARRARERADARTQSLGKQSKPRGASRRDEAADPIPPFQPGKLYVALKDFLARNRGGDVRRALGDGIPARPRAVNARRAVLIGILVLDPSAEELLGGLTDFAALPWTSGDSGHRENDRAEVCRDWGGEAIALLYEALTVLGAITPGVRIEDLCPDLSPRGTVVVPVRPPGSGEVLTEADIDFRSMSPTEAKNSFERVLQNVVFAGLTLAGAADSRRGAEERGERDRIAGLRAREEHFCIVAEGAVDFAIRAVEKVDPSHKPVVGPRPREIAAALLRPLSELRGLLAINHRAPGKDKYTSRIAALIRKVMELRFDVHTMLFDAPDSHEPPSDSTVGNRSVGRELKVPDGAISPQLTSAPRSVSQAESSGDASERNAIQDGSNGFHPPRRVAKLSGWTKAELVAAARISNTTFKKILNAAKVRGPKHGEHSFRFDISSVEKLMVAAKSGKFSKKGKAAAEAWQALIDATYAQDDLDELRKKERGGSNGN